MRIGFWTIVGAPRMADPACSSPLWDRCSCRAFQDQAGNFTLANYERFVGTPRFRAAFLNTLLIGFGGLVGSSFSAPRWPFAWRASRSGGAASSPCWPSWPSSRRRSSAPTRGSSVRLGRPRPADPDVVGHLHPADLRRLGDSDRLLVQVLPVCLSAGLGALANINRSSKRRREPRPDPFQRVMKISFPLVLPALSAGGLLALIHSIADFERRGSSGAASTFSRPKPTRSTRPRSAAISGWRRRSASC